MDMFLMAAALALMGVVTGIYVAVPLHDHFIADLTGTQYMAMHQMRDKTFRRVMPILVFGTIALILVAIVFAIAPGWPRGLAIAALAMFVVEMVLTVRKQIPINQEIQTWTEATIPADWQERRDRWGSNHILRLTLSLCAYACMLAAVFLSLSSN